MSEVYYLNMNMGFLNLLIYFVLEMLVPEKYRLWHPTVNLGLAAISFSCAFLVRFFT